MRIGRCSYIPRVELLFTREDVTTLVELSARHYDRTCRMLSDTGGLIYAIRNRLLENEPETNGIIMNMDEIDLLMKVTECRGIGGDIAEKGIQLHENLYKAFQKLSLEYYVLNPRKPGEKVFCHKVDKDGKVLGSCVRDNGHPGQCRNAEDEGGQFFDGVEQ